MFKSLKVTCVQITCTIEQDGKFVVSVDKARLPDKPEPREVRMTEGGTGNLNCK